jgi:hypothetical protein
MTGPPHSDGIIAASEPDASVTVANRASQLRGNARARAHTVLWCQQVKRSRALTQLNGAPRCRATSASIGGERSEA